MPDLPRQYDADAARVILREAARRQHATPPAAEPEVGLTLAELQQAAAEAGLDPRHVAAAALDHHTPTASEAPHQYLRTMRLPGVLPATKHPALRAALRTAMALPPNTDTPRTSLPADAEATRPFTWHYGPLVEVRMTPEDEGAGAQTRAVVRADWRWPARVRQAAATLGAGLAVGLLTGLTLGGGAGTVLLAALLGVGLGFGASRVVTRRLDARWEARLDAVTAAVATAVPIAPLTGTDAPRTAHTTTAPPLSLPEEPAPDTETPARGSRSGETTS